MVFMYTKVIFVEIWLVIMYTNGNHVYLSDFVEIWLVIMYTYGNNVCLSHFVEIWLVIMYIVLYCIVKPGAMPGFSFIDHAHEGYGPKCA